MKTKKQVMNGSGSNHINVEILVPVNVLDKDRKKFESAMVDFIFGYDRLRPEIEKQIEKSGINLKRLATLSKPEALGACPLPLSLQFIPGPALLNLAKTKGFNFAEGGQVAVRFNYDNKDRKSTKSLFINLELPEPFIVKDGSQNKINAEVIEALFGDCELSDRAQKYLAAYGLDLVSITAQNSKILQSGKIPPTTRVSPAVAKVLDQFGFQTDLLGQIKVQSLSKISINPLKESPMWSKTTCC